MGKKGNREAQRKHFSNEEELQNYVNSLDPISREKFKQEFREFLETEIARREAEASGVDQNRD